MENIIRVYNQDLEKIAYLENAYNITYDLSLNELWYASFTIPADDPKISHCNQFNFIEIYDGRERIGLYRIMPSELTRDEQGNIIFECEHVLSTLMDDVLFQYHQMGGASVGTRSVLEYILSNQEVVRWQLGECDFDRRFEYKWENENLLSSLFSVPKPFDVKYRWTYNTETSPWTISLKEIDTEPIADITYKKNMLEIKKEVDPRNLVNKLYLLGYGEGVNQLTISNINEGIPYLEDLESQASYGIKSSILVDKRFESAETLMGFGQTILDELKNPYKSYSVKALDLYRHSPSKYKKYFPGDIVRIIDNEDGIIEELPIVRVRKNDVTSSPGDVNVEIANKSRNVAGTISELQDRARINELYAQGATNQLIVPFFDNADAENPALMRVYIPDTMARINKLVLNYRLEPFRAYSKAIEGGGGVTQSTASGGASSETSSSGGGVSTSTSDGGGTTKTTSNENVTVSTQDVIGKPGDTPFSTSVAGAHNHSGEVAEDGDHSHFMRNHGHSINVDSHNHEVSIPDHDHNFSVPSHNHDINIPSHSHGITIPDHVHDIEFGIYQGTTANSVTVFVDGVDIGATSENSDIDIIEYLSVNAQGKINRNTWHEIEIVPDQLTRVVANIFLQIFTNSRGGGDY